MNEPWHGLNPPKTGCGNFPERGYKQSVIPRERSDHNL